MATNVAVHRLDESMSLAVELRRPELSTSPSVRSLVGLEDAPLGEATDMIVQNHYLRRGRTMAQLPYWITFDGVRCGVLLFALPRMSSRSPKFDGHSPMQLIELARMWIDPAVQLRSVFDSEGNEHSLPVASRAIALALRRVRQDWIGKYPHLPEPKAVVAWSDTTRHTGTIYKACNFRHVGTSGGVGHRNNRRPNGGSDQLRADYLHVKDAYFLPFDRELSRSERESALAHWEGRRPVRRARRSSPSVSVSVDTVGPFDSVGREGAANG
jgi:hypothetical protein